MLPNDPLAPADLDVDLAALGAAAEPWLARLPVPDGRVQTAPDSRTIRFYQTSGLLDRPSRYDGRTARYGRRHLLQLVAIRALQTSGLSLSQVQTTLAGATDTELQQVVANALSGAGHGVRLQAPVPVPSHPTPHASPYSDPQLALPSTTHSSPYSTSSVPPHSTPQSTHADFIAVELAPGVVVTIDSRTHTDIARTIDALRRALANAPHVAPQGDLP